MNVQVASPGPNAIGGSSDNPLHPALDRRLADREIVDDDGLLAPLFADPGATTGRWPRRRLIGRDVAVTRATRRITLYAVTAPGVADLAIEEAVYTAFDVIACA